jgi:hypothetical protein
MAQKLNPARKLKASQLKPLIKQPAEAKVFYGIAEIKKAL